MDDENGKEKTYKVVCNGQDEKMAGKKIKRFMTSLIMQR